MHKNIGWIKWFIILIVIITIFSLTFWLLMDRQTSKKIDLSQIYHSKDSSFSFNYPKEFTTLKIMQGRTNDPSVALVENQFAKNITAPILVEKIPAILIFPTTDSDAKYIFEHYKEFAEMIYDSNKYTLIKVKGDNLNHAARNYAYHYNVIVSEKLVFKIFGPEQYFVSGGDPKNTTSYKKIMEAILPTFTINQ